MRKIRREKKLKDRQIYRGKRDDSDSSGSDSSDRSDHSDVTSVSEISSDQSEAYNYGHKNKNIELLSPDVFDTTDSDSSAGTEYSDWEYGLEPSDMEMERGVIRKQPR